jgi:hypothetical protein
MSHVLSLIQQLKENVSRAYLKRVNLGKNSSLILIFGTGIFSQGYNNLAIGFGKSYN